MPQTPTRSRRGKSSRISRGLKITIVVLLAFLLLIVLNAFALNNETESAALTVDGAFLIETTSGDLQVLDTGPPPATPGGLLPGPLDPTATEALPIVLIHGTGGAINWWDELIPLLSPDHRVLAIDLLGYGGSDKPKDGYSIDSQAGLVAQVLNSAGVEKAVVVGHSLGGKTATALAESSPDLVSGVVLIDSAPDASFGKLSGGAHAAQWPLLGQALWRLSPDFLIKKNLEQAFAAGFDVPDKYVDDIRQMTYPSYSGSYDASGEFTEASPLNQRLEQTGLPLLVIFGEQDAIIPAREAISSYAAIPGVQSLLIPNIGHSPQVEAPEETAAAINEFADSLLPEPDPVPKPRKKEQQQQAKQKAKQKAPAGNQQ